MPGWVFADPPLASPDFVHFNHMGARIIAEMFYKAFITDYERYLNKSDEWVEMVNPQEREDIDGL